MPDQFAEQIKKLDALRRAEDSSALEEFDDETEQLILQTFGETNAHLEAYELAMMGEAETIVNMPQAAQEETTQGMFHKSIEQRRQVLEGCRADMVAAEPVVEPIMPPAPAVSKPPARAAKQSRVVKKQTTPVKKEAKKKAAVGRKGAKTSGKKAPLKKPVLSKKKRKQSRPAKKRRAART